MELLKNFVMAGNTSWIGLNRKSASEKFSWSDGSQVDYTFWFAGQHQIVASEDEHCVVAYADGGDPEVKWSTAKCSQRHTFICQIPELEVPRHEAQKCHENWRQFCGPDGKCACYAYIKEPMSWLDASDYCTDRYSHLPSVHSLEEAKFLDELTAGDARLPWIGLRLEQDSYVWKDGSPVEFLYWSSDEPDNKNNEEHCSRMGTTAYYQTYSPAEAANALKWSDFKCFNHSETFFCKKLLDDNIPPCDYSRVVCPDGWCRLFK
jgi:hypothetical protein